MLLRSGTRAAIHHDNRAKACEQHFITHTTQQQDGRFVVGSNLDLLASLQNEGYMPLNIRITSENTQVHQSKNDWSQLLDLASACIDREVIKYGRHQEDLAEWRNKCFEFKSLCTPPDINAIDSNTLWNELKYKNTSPSDDK